MEVESSSAAGPGGAFPPPGPARLRPSGAERRFPGERQAPWHDATPHRRRKGPFDTVDFSEDGQNACLAEGNPRSAAVRRAFAGPGGVFPESGQVLWRNVALRRVRHRAAGEARGAVGARNPARRREGPPGPAAELDSTSKVLGPQGIPARPFPGPTRVARRPAERGFPSARQASRPPSPRSTVSKGPLGRRRGVASCQGACLTPGNPRSAPDRRAFDGPGRRT